MAALGDTVLQGLGVLAEGKELSSTSFTCLLSRGAGAGPAHAVEASAHHQANPAPQAPREASICLGASDVLCGCMLSAQQSGGLTKPWAWCTPLPTSFQRPSDPSPA